MRKKCNKCFDGWILFEDENGARRAQRCECYLKEHENRLRSKMNIPKRYEECTIENFEPVTKAHRHAVAEVGIYVEQFPKNHEGFLIYGGTGVGKTHLAIGLMKKIAEKGYSCLFYDFRDLLNDIKATYQPNSSITETEILGRIYYVDVFILDELGAEKTTGWVRDTLMTILNKRYNDQKTTIITTNFTDISSNDEDSLEERIGSRLRSRLYEMCNTIELTGKDYRKERRQVEIRQRFRYNNI
jgi:DNA replication protein DnaC